MSGSDRRAMGLAALTLAAAALPLAFGTLPDKLGILYLALAALILTATTLRFRSQALPATALVVSFSLSLAVIDLASRPFLDDMLYHRPEDRVMNRWPSLPSQIRFPADFSYEGTATGDLSAITGVRKHKEKRRVRFETDRHGFRNAKNGSGPYDAVLLGDSFGVGIGTSQEKTWASLLESHYGLKTYNLSTGGSPWNEYINLKTELPRLELNEGATLVWALFTGNDLGGEYGALEPRLNGPFRRAWVRWQTFRQRSPLRQMLSRMKQAFTAKRGESPVLVRDDGGTPVLFLREFADNEKMTLEAVKRHPNYPRLEEVFREVARLASSKGMKVRVVSVPTKEAVHAAVLGDDALRTQLVSGFAEAVTELSFRNGFSFLDLKPALRDASGQGRLYWADDTHWNDAGHETAARSVGALLARGQSGIVGASQERSE